MHSDCCSLEFQMSYYKFNESQREQTVLKRLKQGEIVALISDARTLFEYILVCCLTFVIFSCTLVWKISHNKTSLPFGGTHIVVKWSWLQFLVDVIPSFFHLNWVKLNWGRMMWKYFSSNLDVVHGYRYMVRVEYSCLFIFPIYPLVLS